MHVSRPDLLGEVLEVGLVDRVGEIDGVVEHDHAVAHGELAEEDARGLRPGAFGLVFGRIVAKHEHVEVVDVDFLDAGVVALQLRRGRLRATRARGLSRERA